MFICAPVRPGVLSTAVAKVVGVVERRNNLGGGEKLQGEVAMHR